LTITLFPLALFSQETDTLQLRFEQELIEKIEAIAASSDSPLDYTELIEDLRFYRENPLNLNYASEDELRRLVFLNNKQMYHLVAYRETFGPILSIYELQAIEGFDKPTINNILPFIKVSIDRDLPKLDFKNVVKYGRHQLIGRYQRLLQQKEGYKNITDSLLEQSPNSRYLGSPDKIYLRYGFNFQNRIRFGITAEKDAGEIFFNKNLPDTIQSIANEKIRNGFDFYSIHFMLSNIGKMKALALGDYQLRFGQGLTMWSGLAFGKSSDAINIKKFSLGISPYTSADENRFFRGIATTWQLGKFELSAFYSSNKIDASIDSSDFVESTEEASLYENGFHRKVNEILKKDALLLDVYGGNLSFRYNRLKIGTTVVYSEYDIDISKDPQLYNWFGFEGKDNINAGIDYHYLFNKMDFYGEFSMSENGGYAMIHGLSVNLHPQFSTSFSYRSYSKDFQNYFSNGFAESHNYNENGFYTGIQFYFAKNWTCKSYYDLFSFPWLKYGINKPSQGNDFLVQIENRNSSSVFYYLRFKQKNKAHNISNFEGHIKPVENTQKSSYRFHIEYAVSENIIMKNRVEYLLNKKSEGYRGVGYLVYHDINWSPYQSNLRLNFRYALFDTDSYDERLYAYENDVLYAFSVPAYYYKGSKVYLMARYRIKDLMNIWVRLSHAWYSDRDKLGSGLDLIKGNKKSEIKFQLQIKI